MSEPRIFVDDDPTPRGSTGPWLVVAVVAVVLAATTFVLSGREPAADGAVVQLPTPTTSSTSTTTQPPTTTTTEPPLLLETWIPAFDRTLHLASIDERGVTVTTWRPGSSPKSTAHAAGAVQWMDFDAESAAFAAISVNTNGQHVLWLGTSDLLEPLLIADVAMTAIFHSDEPGSLAVALSDGTTTEVTTHTIDSEGGLQTLDRLEIDGDLGITSWSSNGLLLTDDRDPLVVTWVHSDLTVEQLDGYVPPQSGAPLLYGDLTSQGYRSATLARDVTVDLPESTVSLSPSTRFAIVDSIFRVQLVDLDQDVALPLTDPTSSVADWSNDDRWFVYLSSIESYRLGELTRYVFVDTTSGTSVSVSLSASQIATPHVLGIEP